MAKGCDCKPTYFVCVHLPGQNTARTKVGKSLRDARRALARIQTQEDEGSWEAPKNIRFKDWGQQWLTGLERPKEGTVLGYGSTIDWATTVFGNKYVRQISLDDIRRLNVEMREAGLSGSTRAKHLRVLHSCLASAVSSGYAARNVVVALPTSERPSKAEESETNEAAYFLDEELPRLFKEFSPGLYRTLFEVAYKTGMRFGELAALTWGDIDWTNRVIHVQRSYRQGLLSSTKNRKRRDVPVTWETVELLNRWADECGRPARGMLIFPGGRSDGFLDNATVGRQLYATMECAGVPRECPEGRARGVKRNFHSFRHTFAKQALEGGRSLFWLSQHLGHSSTAVTDQVYGHFESAKSRQEVDELVFSV